MRLAVLASHPIQYQAPLFCEVAQRHELRVFFAHRPTPDDQAQAGYDVAFDWDVDLLSGYQHHFLENVASNPGLDCFTGCDTPSISEELRRGRFSTLMVMGWHLKSFWQGIVAGKRLGVPVMVRGDSHLDTPRSVLKRVGKRFTYPVGLRIFDVGLFVGVKSLRYWLHYRYPRERLFFSPHCVDNSWFLEREDRLDLSRSFRGQYGIRPDAQVVLFVGRLVPSKRPLDLIEAAQLLSSRVPHLVVLFAGAGPLESEVSRISKSGRFVFINLGFCNQTQLPTVYAAADVLVLPSGRETWGLVANEALACGTPIVVSDSCGCAPDLAGDGIAGCTYPSGSVSALADAIHGVLESPPDPRNMSARAASYSVEAAADGIDEALDWLAMGRRSRK